MEEKAYWEQGENAIRQEPLPCGSVLHILHVTSQKEPHHIISLQVIRERERATNQLNSWDYALLMIAPSNCAYSSALSVDYIVTSDIKERHRESCYYLAMDSAPSAPINSRAPVQSHPCQWDEMTVFIHKPSKKITYRRSTIRTKWDPRWRNTLILVVVIHFDARCLWETMDDDTVLSLGNTIQS